MSRHYASLPSSLTTCVNCKAGNCHECIDILRSVYTNVMICTCKRKNHDGEVVAVQVVDPFTDSVHGPNVVVSKDGEVTFPQSITCPACGMTSHNPNDVKEKYCGNCHKYYDDM